MQQTSRTLLRPRASAVQPAPAARPARSPNFAIKKTALKEWNVAIEALRTGEQTILMRKGGIKEPVFRPSGSEFFLFPTSFHSDEQLLKPGVAGRFKEAMALEPKSVPHIPITTYVQVTGAWVTEDEEVLAALDPLHIWTPKFVESRLKWRASQPLTLLELRAWSLKTPIPLATQPDYFGCFSNVDLAAASEVDQAALEGATPALSDSQFAERQAALRAALAHVKHSELVL